MDRRNFLSAAGKTMLGAGGLSVFPLDMPAWAEAMDDIKSRGKMLVALDPTFSPFEFTDSAGAITGYDPGLLALIAKEWGVKIDFQVMSFNGIIPGLIAGSFDFTCTALNITAERMKRIDYTIPVASTVDVVMRVKGNSTIKGSDINALSGHRCAVKQTSEPEQLMQKLNEQLKAENRPPVQLSSFDTVEQTIATLHEKRVDCVVDDKAGLSQVISAHPTANLEIVGEIGSKAYIGWGINKANPKLTAALDGTLKTLKSNGEMARLQKQFFGYEMNLPDSYVPPA
jgi:polar amino acid transport system substrate-binding protein